MSTGVPMGGGVITGRDGLGNPIVTYYAPVSPPVNEFDALAYYSDLDAQAADPMINRAIVAAAAAGGGIVRLSGGTLQTVAPITVLPGVTLEGPIGRRVAQPGTEVALQCYIRPAASFVGAAAILMLDKEQGGYSGDNNGIRLRHLSLDGSLLGAGSGIDGIKATGLVHDVVLDNVSVYNFPHNGVTTTSYTRLDSSSVHPYSWTVQNCIAQNCGNNGWSLNGLTDAELTAVEALSNGVDGFFLGGVANAHITACRAEWSGQYGFHVTGGWGTSPAGSGGAIFTGCSTDRNTLHGVYIDATGNGSLTFAGLMCRRDGRNGLSGGGGYAGIAANGATMPIVVNGLTCYPGQDDNGTGAQSPDYGASFANCTSVDIVSGYLHGIVGGWLDGGGNTVLRFGPNIGIATGTASAPTRQTAYTWSLRDSLDVQQHALGDAQPREHGLIAWTFDPMAVRSGKAGVAGTVYLAAVYVHRAVSITKIYWGINTAGATPTASENFVGLYNSAGTLLQSAGVDANVTATGLMTATIPSTALAPGLYWVAFLFNAGTMPALYVGGDINATLLNVGMAVAASYRFATNGTGKTSLPATITPANNVAAQFCYWAALG